MKNKISISIDAQCVKGKKTEAEMCGECIVFGVTLALESCLTFGVFILVKDCVAFDKQEFFVASIYISHNSKTNNWFILHLSPSSSTATLAAGMFTALGFGIGLSASWSNFVELEDLDSNLGLLLLMNMCLAILV